MGSNALKPTILDRGHSKEASREVESHFAAQGTREGTATAPDRGGLIWGGLSWVIILVNVCSKLAQKSKT